MKDKKGNVEEAADGATDESYKCDFTNLCEIDKLVNGDYNFVFAHPESLISTKFEQKFDAQQSIQKTYGCHN